MKNVSKISATAFLTGILVAVAFTAIGTHPAYAPPALKYGVMTSGSNAGGFTSPGVGSTITGSAATNDPTVAKVKFQWLDPTGLIVQTTTDTTPTSAGGAECLTSATKYTGGVTQADVTTGAGFMCFSDTFTIPGPTGDWGMKAAFCTASDSCSPPQFVKQRAVSFIAGKPLPCGGAPGTENAVFDRCIDVDGTLTPDDGLSNPANVQVFVGAPLASFPFAVPNGAGLDMFDNDANSAWTFGPVGDDLHVEGTTFCPTGIRDAVHELGADCKVLDKDGSLFTGQLVSCDLELGIVFSTCAPLVGPNSIKYFDANGNGSWDNGEDIVLDGNGDGIFN